MLEDIPNTPPVPNYPRPTVEDWEEEDAAPLDQAFEDGDVDEPCCPSFGEPDSDFDVYGRYVDEAINEDFESLANQLGA